MFLFFLLLFSLNLTFIVVESGKWCGQYCLGFLWVSTEMNWQSPPPCSRLWACVAEKSYPSIDFHCTHIGLHRTARSEPGNIRHNSQRHIPWQLWLYPLPPQGMPRPGFWPTKQVEQSSSSNVGSTKQNGASFPFWLSDSLFCLILGGGRKRRRNLKQYQGHLFQDLKMLVAHISI